MSKHVGGRREPATVRYNALNPLRRARVEVMSLAHLLNRASPQAVKLAEEILRSDIENQAWTSQIGPCLSRRVVARLLGKTEQALAQDRRLFSFRNGDGKVAYPIAQFDGRSIVPGVHEVAEILSAVGDDEWEILSWLSAPKPAFEGRSAFDELRAGNPDAVIDLARHWAEVNAAS